MLIIVHYFNFYFVLKLERPQSLQVYLCTECVVYTSDVLFTTYWVYLVMLFTIGEKTHIFRLFLFIWSVTTLMTLSCCHRYLAPYCIRMAQHLWLYCLCGLHQETKNIYWTCRRFRNLSWIRTCRLVNVLFSPLPLCLMV